VAFTPTLQQFWLARAAKLRPKRLVKMVEQFCQWLYGYFLDRHQDITRFQSVEVVLSFLRLQIGTPSNLR
jgi:hypothetical protein